MLIVIFRHPGNFADLFWWFIILFSRLSNQFVYQNSSVSVFFCFSFDTHIYKVRIFISYLLNVFFYLVVPKIWIKYQSFLRWYRNLRWTERSYCLHFFLPGIMLEISDWTIGSFIICRSIKHPIPNFMVNIQRT